METGTESLVVAARSGGNKTPVWSVHPVGGSALWIRHLAPVFSDRPVLGIQARGMDGRHPPFETVEEMAEHYVGLVKERQPRGPYLLSGASFGGTVAFEMAHQLQTSGSKVGLLAMFDSFGPNYPPRRAFLTRLAGAFGRMRSLPWADRVAYVRGRMLPSTSTSPLTHGLQDVADSPIVRALKGVIDANHKAMERYRFRPYSGRVTLLRTRERFEWLPPKEDDPTNGWSVVANDGVDVIEIEGDHRKMLDPPQVADLAEKFAALVDGTLSADALVHHEPSRRHVA